MRPTQDSSTTQSRFWEKMGFENDDATALADNVRNFVSDVLGEQEAEFDYAEAFAADYVPAYEIWAASNGVISRSTGF